MPGSVARTSAGVAYTVPFAQPRPGSLRRSRWTESQLALRASEFTETKDLLVFVGSWNVNAKKPRDEPDLAPWLLHRVKCKGEKKGAQEDDGGDSGDEDGSGTGGDSSRFKAPDVYVIGFQEIVDLNASNLLGDHSASDPWERRILATLSRTGKEYVRVTSVHLVGLSMAVFCKEKHRLAISDVRVDEVGVGIMGVGGNKGAVLVKMKIYKTVFAFVNSHLAAHQNAVQARNSDFWNIVRRASFDGPRKTRVCSHLADGEWIDAEEHRRRGLPASQAGSATAQLDNLAASASSLFDSGMSKFKTIMDNVAQKKAERQSAAAQAASAASAANGWTMAGSDTEAAFASSSSASSSAPSSVEDWAALRSNPHGLFGGTSHLVWLGDNNYRLDVVDLGMDRVHRMIAQADWDALLAYDQLIKEKRARRAFPGFTEPPITFPPTYKFIAGTSTYDRREDKKVRFPAWCDRIQFMTCKPPRRPGGLQALQVASATGNLVLNAMHAEYYASTWSLQASDHKPVMSLLVAPVIFEREKSKRKIVESLELLSDEECAPRVLLSANEMDFGVVPFEFPVTRSFQIRNVGDAVASFTIISQAAGASASSAAGALGGHDAVLTKPWLRVLPSSGVLARDATLTVHVTMHVSARSGAAPLLNTDADSLASTLLLRLDGGYVFRIGMDAMYEKSLAGCDLSYMTALLKTPIRSADPAEVLSLDSRAASVPHALFALLDYAVQGKNILKAKQRAFEEPQYVEEEDDDDEDDASATAVAEAEEGEEEISRSAASRRRRAAKAAARSSGVPQQVVTQEMRWILHYLDTGRSLDKPFKSKQWLSPAAPAPPREDPPWSPSELPASAFLHTLLFLLASLPSPLLVASPSTPWVSGMDLTAWCYQTLLESDVEKYRTLVYVLSFARDAVQQKRANGCDVEALARMLGVALAHRAPNAPLSPIMPITTTNILLHLITSPDLARLPDDNAEHHAARVASIAYAQAGPRQRYPDIQ